MILNFRVKLKKTKEHRNSRLKFNLDRLKDPSIHESFQETVGGNFAASTPSTSRPNSDG